jgi:uridylate kinase
MKDAIVLSLGGSLIYPDDIDVVYLKKIRAMILKFVDQGKRFGIICGGGSICRIYIKKANEVLDLERIQNDRIGIATTWANAQLVRELFGDLAHDEVIKDYSKKIKTDKSIVIGAGWQPGCSTDKDAVLLGVDFGAKTVINLTNVDFVYNKDPRKHKDAQPIEKATWEEFKAIVGGEWKAGMNLPFDPIAAALAEKENIQVVILNGHDLDNLQAYLAGKEFKGTVIG